MTADSQSTAARTARQMLFLVAAGVSALGCTHAGSSPDIDGPLYMQGRIHVDREIALRWEANERAVRAIGDKIQPIPVRPTDSTGVPFGRNASEQLRALAPSERHGASDKRMLSMLQPNAPTRAFVSSGVLAQITLVKGIEYKSENAFAKGWLPLAILVVPDSASGKELYPKLKLHGGTSWLYVRERSATKWEAAIVRVIDGKIEQEPLDITIASGDDLEPVIGARFNWEDDDESIWAYCGGKCCRMTAHAL